jgi:ABC-type lipoprotein export system ATPase subunit
MIEIFLQDKQINIFKKVIFILGKSGSGKTTFLKSIYEKKYLIKKNGENLNKIGFMLQESVLFPHWSVEENLILPQKITNDSFDEKVLKKRIEELLIQFSIKDLIHKNIHVLSGGEKQRLALIRVLLMNPEIILFDEPTSALDIANIEIFKKIIEEMQVCCMIVSHDLNLAREIGEEFIIIKNKNEINKIDDFSLVKI